MDRFLMGKKSRIQSTETVMFANNRYKCYEKW